MARFLKIILFLSFAIFLASANVHATNILDGYVGADHHGYGDVIGNSDWFDISGAEVSLVGNTLTVDIYTAFAGRGDNGDFSSYTESGNGIGYGDLFLTTTWSPYGSEPYLNDNHSTGTTWTYAVGLGDDRWSSTGGSATLYSLTGGNNSADALLSEIS